MSKNNKRTKSPIKEIKEFDEEVIQIDRVTRVVKGGRRLRFRATVVIGNRKGKVGMGVGKSTEVTGAIAKAIAKAKKSLIQVPITGTTIPHRIDMKYKSAKIMIKPALPGTGIKAGGPLRKVIDLAGIKDIIAKSFGSNNKLNNSHIAVLALAKLKAIPWLKLNKAQTLSDTEAKPGSSEAGNSEKKAHTPNNSAKKVAPKSPKAAPSQEKKEA